MENWFNGVKNKKIIFFSLIIILLLVILVYLAIIYKYVQKKSFTNELIEFCKKNEEEIFAIEKIYLCSSANVTDNKELENLNIYQYTDMAIYINNFANINGLNNENTVKGLYIDNIQLTSESNLGQKSLLYTNLLTIGDRNSSVDFTHKERIDFNIVYTNEQNESADYSEATFYTDCSNPITLRYINDLGSNYSLEEEDSVVFDGSILEKAGISINDINCKIKFKVNVINNNDDYFFCWVNFNIPLNDIYQGTTIKSNSKLKYNFFMI